MPENHQPSNNGALTSWKEIAAHFHREVRTVQRWEKEEGLPVHRHLHHRQSSVYAYAEELEAWWHERGAQLAAASPPTSWEKRNSWFLLSAVPIVLVLVGLFLWKNPHPAPDPPAVVAAPQFHTVVFSGTRPGGMLYQGLIGDLNGDGRGDLVLSAYMAREAYVLFGRNRPLEGGELPENADVVITHAGGLGLLAGSIGDFNGDGFDDLVLTHWLDEPDAFRRTGPSYILWGRSSWPKRIRLPEQADATLRLDYPSDAKMGACNTSGSVSDVNGDGIADLLLDAYEHGLPDRLSSGTLFVLYGRKRWPREVEVASFVPDVGKNHVSLYGDVSLNVARGLSLNLNASVDSIRDQITLPRVEATSEEILVNQRQLATNYRYFVYFGVSYTFGSIFSPIVNPRFGGGG